MKKIKQLIIITAIFALTLPTVILADSIPESFSVRGNVTTDGQDTEIGTIISVEKDNKEIAVTTVTIEGKYLVEISAENAGETLIYKIDGFPFISKDTNPTGIPLSQNIDLVVYDMLGRKITTIFSGNLSDGSYEYQWNGINANNEKVSSGIYYITAMSDNRQEWKIITLVK